MLVQSITENQSLPSLTQERSQLNAGPLTPWPFPLLHTLVRHKTPKLENVYHQVQDPAVITLLNNPQKLGCGPHLPTYLIADLAVFSSATAKLQCCILVFSLYLCLG